MTICPERCEVYLCFLSVLVVSWLHPVKTQGITSECKPSDAYIGESAFITCYFGTDLQENTKPFRVYQYSLVPQSNGKQGEKIIVDCHWLVSGELRCEPTAAGYEFNKTVTDQVVVAIPKVSLDIQGRYECKAEPSYPRDITPCFFLVKDKAPAPIPPTPDDFYSQDDSTGNTGDEGGDYMAVIIPVVVVVFLVVLLAVIIFGCQKRIQKRFPWICCWRRSQDQPVSQEDPEMQASETKLSKTELRVINETEKLLMHTDKDESADAVPLAEEGREKLLTSDSNVSSPEKVEPPAAAAQKEDTTSLNKTLEESGKSHTTEADEQKGTQDSPGKEYSEERPHHTREECQVVSSSEVVPVQVAEARDQIKDSKAASQGADNQTRDKTETSTEGRGTEEWTEWEKTNSLNVQFYRNEIESRPDGKLIDDIHRHWKHNLDLLERHHQYIQWLFPVPEPPQNNRRAQQLYPHEAEAIRSDPVAMRRLVTSYEMMLHFFGLQLVDKDTGEIARADNWQERFRHLQKSTHNYMRITRILTCLGNMGLEHYKAPFILHVLMEIMQGNLLNTLDSCCRFWIPTLGDGQEKNELIEMYKAIIADRSLMVGQYS